MLDPSGASGPKGADHTPGQKPTDNLQKSGKSFKSSPEAAKGGDSTPKVMTQKEMWHKLYTQMEFAWNTSLKQMMAKTKRALNEIKKQAENQ